MAGRLEEKGIDRKGRWTWAQLTGKKGKKLLVISAYRVSQTYLSEAGYTTAFMQQYKACTKANISNPKPKQRCLVNLAKFIEQWKSTHTDSSIILMMDANGDGSDTHLQTFIKDTALQDIVAYYTP